MNSAVKIIKRGQNKISTVDLASQEERTGAQSTREIAKTVKGWISELQQRRQDEQVRSSALRRVTASLSLLILSFCGLGSESQGQQLRDAFHSSRRAVFEVAAKAKPSEPPDLLKLSIPTTQ
jgi:hypothetical protein